MNFLTHLMEIIFSPVYVIHFITHRCNLLCGFCCDQRNRGSKEELSIDHIKKFYSSLYAAQLTITGGEPVLRDDLPEILRHALQARVGTVSLNTNGTMPERLEQVLSKVFLQFHHPKLKVNLSMDGFRPTHDRIRKCNGAFDGVQESYDRLLRLQKKWPGLSIRINTVVTHDNAVEVGRFRDFVRFRFSGIDDHVFSLHRADQGERIVPELLKAYREVTRQHYPTNTWIPKQIFLKRIHDYMYHRIAMIADGKTGTFHCPAGSRFVEVGAAGQVFGCEVLEKEKAFLGDLADYNWRLSSVLKGESAIQFRKRIRQERCACTFECIHLTAAALEWPKTLLLPRSPLF